MKVVQLINLRAAGHFTTLAPSVLRSVLMVFWAKRSPCADHRYILFCIYRYCRGCKKRRSLRSNSFFEEFPRISVGKILLCIYFFLEDESQKSASRKICLKKEKTSVDLEYNPIIPFAGSGIVVKCDESKFNHKAKVGKQSVFFFHVSKPALPGHIMECLFVA